MLRLLISAQIDQLTAESSGGHCQRLHLGAQQPIRCRRSSSIRYRLLISPIFLSLRHLIGYVSVRFYFPVKIKKIPQDGRRSRSDQSARLEVVQSGRHPPVGGIREIARPKGSQRPLDQVKSLFEGKITEKSYPDVLQRGFTGRNDGNSLLVQLAESVVQQLRVRRC